MGGRLTRVEQRERNRAKVLAAAREEFVQRGFRDAKVDGIADRAGLTRGAVYSNFPGKRALYFAVLADLAEARPPATAPGHTAQATAADDTPAQATAAGDASTAHADPAGGARTARESLAALARAWVARLPLTTVPLGTAAGTGQDDDGAQAAALLGVDLIPEILADDRLRQPFAQLLKLDAIVLGLALEGLRPERPPGVRMVRVAEAVLTTLSGASQMAAAAPGFLEPFDVVTVCERLADLELGGGWPPTSTGRPASAVDEEWSPPDTVDAVRGTPFRVGDGLVAVLGLHRLEAAEDAVRAAPAGTPVTAVLVTGDPGELGPLARLMVADLSRCLREAFPPAAWPSLRIVHDESGALAAAAGVPAVSDVTETAVRVEAGRVVARADGRGSCYAAVGEDAAARS